MPSTKMNQLTDLPYFENSADLFSHIATQDWSIFLDSGYPSISTGRYDILVTEPVATIVTKKNMTTVTTQLSRKHYKKTSPFAVLRSTLNHYRIKEQTIQQQLPFLGGALGYFSYDLSRTIETLTHLANDDEALPEMAVGIYTWAIVVDHKKKKSYLTGHIRKKDAHWTWKKLISTFSQPPSSTRDEKKFTVTGSITSNFTYPQYVEAFKKVKQYIIAGDCYQINLTQRFSAPACGQPWSAYQQLRKLNSAPFSAYINMPFAHILSSSPERFLQVKDGKVETNPIKGTRPRSTNQQEDKKQIKSLQTSSKDRAENVMIVDLLRNDMGKVCQHGSITVPTLFSVESFATVHHLVSTIKGTLKKDKDAIDLLKACFPGGSITGAPKIRAMEIIEALEPHRRGIYCGSIGYIGFNGNMDTNIAIRTLIYNQNTIRFWVGGGIIYDSKVNAEYQETLDKGKALLELLNNLKNDDHDL